MGRYVIRRGLSSVVTLILLLVALFFVVRTTGDPVKLILGPDATQEQYAALTHTLGYDRPLLGSSAITWPSSRGATSASPSRAERRRSTSCSARSRRRCSSDRSRSSSA